MSNQTMRQASKREFKAEEVTYNVTGLNEGAIKSTSLSQTTNDYRMRNSINNHNTALSFKPMLPERVGIVRGVVGFNKNCEAGAFLFTL